MENNLPLKTPRTLLRRLSVDDASALFKIYGNPDVAKFQFGEAWTADQVVDLIYSQSEVYIGAPGVPYILAVVERSEGVLIGSIELSINSVEDRQGELGFSFNPDYCGRGLATESIHAAMGFAFTQMELHRIFAGVDTLNERSWRLMERIGMRREAHFVHANLVDGEWADDYTYALLENEWRPLNTE